MSMTTFVVRLAKTHSLPFTPSVAITWLLIVCPRAKLRFDASGMLDPPMRQVFRSRFCIASSAIVSN